MCDELESIDVYCLHHFNDKLLNDTEFKNYIKNIKYKYFVLKTNHICVHVLDSIHYNVLSGNVTFSLYDKYVRFTNQHEHSVMIFKNLIQNFDINKMKNILVYKKIIENDEKVIISDGCHRISILLFNKYPNIHKYIRIS